MTTFPRAALLGVAALAVAAVAGGVVAERAATTRVEQTVEDRLACRFGLDPGLAPTVRVHGDVLGPWLFGTTIAGLDIDAASVPLAGLARAATGTATGTATSAAADVVLRQVHVSLTDLHVPGRGASGGSFAAGAGTASAVLSVDDLAVLLRERLDRPGLSLTVEDGMLAVSPGAADAATSGDGTDDGTSGDGTSDDGTTGDGTSDDGTTGDGTTGAGKADGKGKGAGKGAGLRARLRARLSLDGLTVMLAVSTADDALTLTPQSVRLSGSEIPIGVARTLLSARGGSTAALLDARTMPLPALPDGIDLSSVEVVTASDQVPAGLRLSARIGAGQRKLAASGACGAAAAAPSSSSSALTSSASGPSTGAPSAAPSSASLAPPSLTRAASAPTALGSRRS